MIKNDTKVALYINHSVNENTNKKMYQKTSNKYTKNIDGRNRSGFFKHLIHLPFRPDFQLKSLPALYSDVICHDFSAKSVTIYYYNSHMYHI